MNRGTVGARNLNVELQQILNPREDGITRGSRNFRVNDKVMQIRNNYDKEVYNGDIGRILKINTEDQEVTVLFDGRAGGLRLLGSGRARAGLRRIRAQISRLRISLRGHSPAHPALRHAAEESHLHGDHPREETRDPRGQQEGFGDSGQE